MLVLKLIKSYLARSWHSLELWNHVGFIRFLLTRISKRFSIFLARCTIEIRNTFIMPTSGIQSYKSFGKITFCSIAECCFSSRNSIRFGIKGLCTSIFIYYFYTEFLFGNLYSLEKWMAFLDNELFVGCRRIDSEVTTDICFIYFFWRILDIRMLV